MKDGSCTFYPGCPPCFGYCGTHLAPSDPPDNIPCEGCESCKAQKAKGTFMNDNSLINNPCKDCVCCKIDSYHKAGMIDENGRPRCFGMYDFPFACKDAGKTACIHCKTATDNNPG